MQTFIIKCIRCLNIPTRIFKGHKARVLENNIISSFIPKIYCDLITCFIYLFFYFIFSIYYIHSWKEIENYNIRAVIHLIQSTYMEYNRHKMADWRHLCIKAMTAYMYTAKYCSTHSLHIRKTCP